MTSFSAIAVSNIRRKVREGREGRADLLPAVNQMLTTIRKASSANAQSVK